MFKKLFLIVVLHCSGCAIGPLPYVPYAEINSMFPQLPQRYYTPLILRDIDQSNIRVICNNRWWYAGPSRGWYSINNAFHPKPRDIWPNKVYNKIWPERYQTKGTTWNSNILYF